jgi:hypothetical protein
MARDARPGTRAWPSRNPAVDEKIGMRWDWGETIGDGDDQGRNLVLQANKGAKQRGLKRLASRNSHSKLVTIRLPLQHPLELEEFIRGWEDGLSDLYRK